MIVISGKDATNGWCIYTLHDMQGKLVFVWFSKISNALSMRDALSNPAFDVIKPHVFTLQAVYNSHREAQNAMAGWFQAYGMPALNKTVRWNRRTKVICHETGIEYKNQLDCARQLGLNQSQLSKHLRRVAGHMSINGMTFSNVADNAATTPNQAGLQPPGFSPVKS